VPHAEQELLIISENLSIPLLPYLSWKELHVYLNTINTTGATCGAGTAYHFGEPEYTPLPYLSWKEFHVYLNTINTTGATCGAGTAYHFGEPEYTPAPLSFMERTVMYILTG
jgi:hypothetical protein